MFISHYNGHGIKLVRSLSTVDNTRDYVHVSHSRQWSNYNTLSRSRLDRSICISMRFNTRYTQIA